MTSLTYGAMQVAADARALRGDAAALEVLVANVEPDAAYLRGTSVSKRPSVPPDTRPSVYRDLSMSGNQPDYDTTNARVFAAEATRRLRKSIDAIDWLGWVGVAGKSRLYTTPDGTIRWRTVEGDDVQITGSTGAALNTMVVGGVTVFVDPDCPPDRFYIVERVTQTRKRPSNRRTKKQLMMHPRQLTKFRGIADLSAHVHGMVARGEIS